jgi:hypothetical protein
MTDLKTEEKRIGTGKPGPGRPPGCPNKATAAVREAFEAFMQANTEKMQALFDKTAEKDPYKALDLLARFAEFVTPKLARTETKLSGDEEKPAALIIKRSERPRA